jgi:hypothetical protein
MEPVEALLSVPAPFAAKDRSNAQHVRQCVCTQKHPSIADPHDYPASNGRRMCICKDGCAAQQPVGAISVERGALSHAATIR